MTAKAQVGRRDFVKLVGGAGLLAMAGGTALKGADAPKAPADAAAEKPLIDGTPAVFAPTADAATIVWTVNGAARGWVEYGTDPEKLDMRSGGDPMGYTPHDERVLKVRLRGLAPGTRYWWRGACVALAPASPKASSQNPPKEPPPQYTAVYSFRTLAPSARESSFIMWNDTHENPKILEGLGRMAAEDAGVRQPDFLLWNGDITKRNINDASLIPGTFVHPIGGVDLAKGPPVFLTRGNHDVRGTWANKVIDYVDFPDTHEGGVARPFYAFRSGPLGAIVLDTGEDKPDRHSSFRGLAAFEPLIAEQARWLEKIIERPDIKNAPVKVVFCHIPLRWTNEKPQDYFAKPAGFDRYSKRGREAWSATLVKWGVRVIISGHVHRWTHIPADDKFPYAQITSGGSATESARLLRGRVTEKDLRVTVHKLDGSEVASLVF